eukprot:GHVU01068185.1.p4 GENE.GHVU01068185.1~~GHVU01068185.1.p4  ORF type:complete len:122 (-),score=18.26 GHVU01068185.1:1928-2293(-)
MDRVGNHVVGFSATANELAALCAENESVKGAEAINSNGLIIAQYGQVHRWALGAELPKLWCKLEEAVADGSGGAVGQLNEGDRQREGDLACPGSSGELSQANLDSLCNRSDCTITIETNKK